MTLRYPEVLNHASAMSSNPSKPYLPQDPAQDERDALDAYFRLSARLYPCGECAAEFQMLLKKFPPQVCHGMFIFFADTRNSRHSKDIISTLCGQLVRSTQPWCMLMLFFLDSHAYHTGYASFTIK